MTQLALFDEHNPGEALLRTENFAEIQAELDAVGILLRRWEASHPVTRESSNEDILAAYQPEIEALVAQEGYSSWDVVSMHPDHPEKAAFRQKFLAEHTHAEDEVRFFVRGRGLFTLHLKGRIFELLCTQGDLVSVPAGTRHWFDMGPEPEFTAIRLFNNPEGWVAQFTGSDIADRFSRLGA